MSGNRALGFAVLKLVRSLCAALGVEVKLCVLDGWAMCTLFSFAWPLKQPTLESTPRHHRRTKWPAPGGVTNRVGRERLRKGLCGSVTPAAQLACSYPRSQCWTARAQRAPPLATDQTGKTAAWSEHEPPRVALSFTEETAAIEPSQGRWEAANAEPVYVRAVVCVAAGMCEHTVTDC